MGRRRLLGLMTATPAALASAHLLQGCGGSQVGVEDAGPSMTDGALPDSMPDGMADAMLDAMPDGMADATPDASVMCSQTTPDALGPFYSAGAPVRESLAQAGEAGTPLRIEGRILDVSDCGSPLVGWGLDLWQADVEGGYHDGPSTDYRLRGRVITDAEGRFAFSTIKPGQYPLGGSFRPAHIHFRIFSPSGAVVVTSQLYFEGDPYLSPADPCGPPTCFSDDPARIVRLVPAMVEGEMGEMGMLPLFVETT